MAGTFNINYNPAQVMMGGPARGVSGWAGSQPAPVGKPVPYLPISPVSGPKSHLPSGSGNPAQPVGPVAKPVGPAPFAPPTTPKPPQHGPSAATVQAQPIRATGTGPYDPSYRQDLATFAGGNFLQPSGGLSFNPTGQLTGNPTGVGSAPVQGMPTTLLSQALGGQGFAYTPPAPTAPASATTAVNPQQSMQNWLQMLMGGVSY
jgi:hypothetical protein